jgi:uncharacterized protein (TIGR02466 family)
MIEADWLQNSDVYSLFPTLVWKIQLPTHIVVNQNPAIIKALEKLNPDLHEIAAAASWQSHQSLHNDTELATLMSCISGAAHKILRFLNIGATDIKVTGCWANVCSAGASHRMHSHPNNYLSGVYYVSAATGANTINFHDPRSQAGIIRPPITQLTGQNTDQVVLEVTDGTLLLFPSYLMHSVDPNDSDELRISISFNLMFSQYAEKMSRPLWQPRTSEV